jgi:hypothetical protein
MDNLTWKVKQMFRKLMPLLIGAVVLYGGYNLYRKGTFRHGIMPGVTSMLRNVPVLGSHFRRSGWGSTAYRSSYGNSHRRNRGHRGHGRRHHRRHR